MSNRYEFPVGIPPGMVPSIPEEDRGIDRYGSSMRVIRREILPGDDAMIFWNSLPEEVREKIVENIKGIYIRRVNESFFGNPECLCPCDGVYELCPIHKTKSSPR